MKKQYKDYIIAIFLILIVVYLTYDNIERFFIGGQGIRGRMRKIRQKSKNKFTKEQNILNQKEKKLRNELDVQKSSLLSLGKTTYIVLLEEPEKKSKQI